MDETALTPHQNVQQVWFAGVHSDVGGWYQSETFPTSLSYGCWRMPKKHDLRLKAGWRDGITGKPLGKMHESRTGFGGFGRLSFAKFPKGAKIYSGVLTRRAEPSANYSRNFQQSIPSGN